MFDGARTEVRVDGSLAQEVFKVETNVSAADSKKVEDMLKEVVANAIPYVVPSKGHFYNGVSTVSLVPLTIGQVVDIEKVYSAKTAYEQFAKFVGIVNGSVYGVKTLKLTMRDFYALCYNLRGLSYKNDPIMVTISKQISDRVVDLVSPVVASSIKTNNLDNFISNDNYDYLRVEDQLYLLENEDKLGQYEKLYFAYVHGASPVEKLANFRSLPADKFAELLKYVYDAQHGLQDIVQVKLPDTGELVEQELVFEYTMFFPSFIQENIYSNAIQAS
jgi:hypothetical protein